MNTGLGISFNLTVPAMQNVDCIVDGSFSLTVVTLMTNTVTATDTITSASTDRDVEQQPPPEHADPRKRRGGENGVDEHRERHLQRATRDLPITVTNAGTTDLNLGAVLRLEDRLKLNTNSVPLVATYVSSTCTVSAPTPPQFWS